MLTNIIIRLIIANIDRLSRREHDLNRRITADTFATNACYLAHRRDAAAAERSILSAMLRVYLASGNTAHSRRRAA